MMALEAVQCQVCAKRSADTMCCCALPFPQLCKPCQVQHSHTAAARSHWTLPIQCLDRVNTLEDADQYRQLRTQLELATQEMVENCTRIADCQDLIRSMCERRKRELEDFASLQISQLEALKAFLQASIPQSREEVEKGLLSTTFSWNSVGNLLSQAAHSNDYSHLRLFEYLEVHSAPNLLDLLPVEWTSKVTSTGAASGLLNPNVTVKEACKSLETASFSDLNSLTATCKELEKGNGVPYEGFLNAYLRHYFIGSKAVEETMKHDVSANMAKKEWVKLQKMRFADYLPLQSTANYAQFEAKLVKEAIKAYDFSHIQSQSEPNRQSNVTIEDFLEASDPPVPVASYDLLTSTFICLWVLITMANFDFPRSPSEVTTLSLLRVYFLAFGLCVMVWTNAVKWSSVLVKLQGLVLCGFVLVRFSVKYYGAQEGGFDEVVAAVLALLAASGLCRTAVCKVRSSYRELVTE